MEVQPVRASRPTLTVVTNLPQQTNAKRTDGTAFTNHDLLKTRALSSSSTCVASPSSTCASASIGPPPTPSMVRTLSHKSSTPTAATRPRGSKYCSDPDCASPMAAEAMSSKGSEPSAVRPASAPVSSGPHVSTMSSDTYFKLLKKSQVLEHLVQLSSHVGQSEQRVRRLQCEQARSQCVQDRVFAELERYRRQVVDAQQQFLGLIESLTALCLREERADDSELQHPASAEEQTLADLQRASSPTSRCSSTCGGLTLETQALSAVGRQRVQQLEAICARYERQLVGSEAALSQAIYSDTARESAAKIAQLEARNSDPRTANNSRTRAYLHGQLQACTTNIRVRLIATCE